MIVTKPSIDHVKAYLSEQAVHFEEENQDVLTVFFDDYFYVIAQNETVLSIVCSSKEVIDANQLSYAHAFIDKVYETRKFPLLYLSESEDGLRLSAGMNYPVNLKSTKEQMYDFINSAFAITQDTIELFLSNENEGK
ncbi:MAG: hypothetical protein Q4E22_03990 [Coriobacteriia bacterium]|nr:hypothetical protein [Coriobacteriia bacterium]